MASMLAAGGYRRAVLAVTVTGTVCAGVAWFLYRARADRAGQAGQTPAEKGEESVKPQVKDSQKESAKAEKLPEKTTVPLKAEEPVAAPAKPKSDTPAVKPPTAAKPLEPSVNKGFVAKVETIVGATTAMAKAAVVAPIPVVAASPATRDPAKEQAEDAKKMAEKGLPGKETALSGDGPLSLGSLDSRFDSDIIIIEDVDKAEAAEDISTKLGTATSHVVTGAGDIIRGDVPLPGGIPLAKGPSEQPDTVAPISMGALSSLGDDIEIIHDSPASTDTTDSLVSGEFVKCDTLDVERSTDLSQSIEIIKEPVEEDDNTREDTFAHEDTFAREATRVRAAETTRDDEDSNANFQPTSSTDNVVAGPTRPKKEVNDNKPEGK